MSGIVTRFDAVIIAFVTKIVGRSSAFDGAVVALQATNLVLEVLVAAYWWAWLRPGDRETMRHRRSILAMSMLGVVGSVGVSMLLKAALPGRGRPLHELSALGAHGFALAPQDAAFHASFPSHHLMVACALVTGLFLVSRTAGVAGALWAGVVMGGPEIYLGLHYPSDLVGGAALGTAVVLVFNLPAVRRVVGERVAALAEDRPALFYPIWFVITLQAATLFSDGGPVLHWLNAVFGRGGFMRR